MKSTPNRHDTAMTIVNAIANSFLFNIAVVFIITLLIFSKYSKYYTFRLPVPIYPLVICHIY